MIDYTLVSEGAVLRDYIDVPYKNDEHKLLVDIADSMYNVGIDPDDFKDEYKKVYKQYGDDYFTKVIQDMEALDSQLYNDSKVEELVADYQDRLGTVSESYKKESNGREISIVGEDVRPLDPSFDSDNELSFVWELWMDVDSYFGTDTRDTDDWINFYTTYHRDTDDITASWTVEGNDYSDFMDEWELTNEEKKYLRNKLEEFCQEEEGLSLREYFDEFNEGE